MNDTKDAREISVNGVIGLVFGLALLVLGGWIGWDFHTIWQTWPTVDAEVIGGDVEESAQYPTAREGIATRLFTPRIEFRYTLHEKPYVTRAWLNPLDSQEKAQKSLLAGYPPGSHQMIRYNPKDPTDIRLGTADFSMLASSVVLLAAGLVLCAMGMSALAASPRAGASGAPGWWQRAKISGRVLGFRPPAGPSSDAIATIRCPSCGRQVEANQDTCPNCLKSLRAA